MTARLAEILATVGYLGKLPGARGTYASIATTLVLAAVAPRSLPIPPALLVSAVGLVTVAGVLASAAVARASGLEDPQTVVIDEVAGQLLTFAVVPITPANLLVGTVLFRIFDMWKPYPIRRLEHLAHGVGIMADDLAAGVYANILLQLASLGLRM